MTNKSRRSKPVSIDTQDVPRSSIDAPKVRKARAIIVEFESTDDSKNRVIVSRIAVAQERRSTLAGSDERLVLELWRNIRTDEVPSLSFIELTLEQASAVRDAFNEVLR